MEQAWRRSAALILALGKSGEDLPRLVMVQRSSGSSFMPGSHVFPGGLCSEADFSSDWLPVFGSSRAKQFLDLPTADRANGTLHSATRPPTSSSGCPDPGSADGWHRASELAAPPAGPSRLPPGVGLRITAIREVFEETGLLLAGNADDTDDATWPGRLAEAGRCRARVQADASQFVSVCREQRLFPDLARLHQWSRWLTPAGHKTGRRYDTTFYLAAPAAAEVGADVAANLLPDAGEVTSVKVDRADSLLRDHLERRLLIAPPQIYDLARLSTFGSISELVQTARQRESLGLELWAAVAVAVRDGMLYVLPGDDLYPATGKDSGPLSLDLTVDQAMKQHARHNRVFALRGQLLQLSVNIPLRLGQRAPPPMLSHCLKDPKDSHL